MPAGSPGVIIAGGIMAGLLIDGRFISIISCQLEYSSVVFHARQHFFGGR
jgi:hypothetical protein